MFGLSGHCDNQQSLRGNQVVNELSSVVDGEADACLGRSRSREHRLREGLLREAYTVNWAELMGSLRVGIEFVYPRAFYNIWTVFEIIIVKVIVYCQWISPSKRTIKVVLKRFRDWFQS
jgi:hypothetical protein